VPLTISLCMIVKNSESSIKKSINSVKNVVDEIIVVDTGSSDNTKEVALKLGAEVINCIWSNNFSGPRNISIKNAKCDWILVLDADEYLSLSSCSVVKTAIENPLFDSYWMNWKQPNENENWFRSFKNTLFRNNSGICFDGLVHEEIYKSVKRERTKFIDATIVHEPTKVNLQEKEIYYLELIKQQLKQEPESSRWKYWCGQHHFNLGNLNDAIDHWLDASKCKKRPYFSLISVLSLADIYLGPKSSLKDAFYYLEKAEKFLKTHNTDETLLMHKEIPNVVELFRKTIRYRANVNT